MYHLLHYHQQNTLVGNNWKKNSKFVPPDALKMHSLALSVLRFPCKLFCKLLKVTLWNTLLCWWFLKKNSYIQFWKIGMVINFWDLLSNQSWKDAATSTVGITLISLNYLCHLLMEASLLKNQEEKVNICVIYY